MAFATAHPIRLLLISALVLYGLLIIGVVALFGENVGYILGEATLFLAAVVLVATAALAALFAIWRRTWMVSDVIGLLLLAAYASLVGLLGLSSLINPVQDAGYIMVPRPPTHAVGPAPAAAPEPTSPTGTTAAPAQ